MTEIIEWLKIGGLIQVMIFLVPGFIAWKVDQLRQPQGEQNARDAIVEILVFGTVNVLLWSFAVQPSRWAEWPSQVSDVLLLITEVIFSPVLLAVVYSYVIEWAAKQGWVSWPHPTAWDWIFRSQARRQAFAVILTLKDGRRVAGAFINDGFASLYPYPKDLLLGEVWRLDDEGRFEERISGTRGVYVEKGHSYDGIV